MTTDASSTSSGAGGETVLCPCCHAANGCRCTPAEMQPCGACLIHCWRDGCRCEPADDAAGSAGEGA